MNYNYLNLSEVNSKYYHLKHLHLLTYSNMYQYHKKFEDEYLATLKTLAYRYAIINIIAMSLFFERSNAFLFGPNDTQPRKTKS